MIYIVKENRTYDQVLGDMKEGNGDASLVLFGERVTPNLHKLAREFVLLDNFYVNSDVSADGHNWSTAAIAPDYVEKMWPNSYAKRRDLSDYAGQEPTAVPGAGFLWTNAAQRGITMRNYGYYVANLPKPGPEGGVQISGVRDPVLNRVTNTQYRGFDLDYPDVARAKVFLQDLAEFEKSGQMPRLVVMRLGSDHTSGSAAGKIIAALDERRQRLRGGNAGGGGVAQPLLGIDSDLRAGRRRAERSGPRGFPPLAGLPDFALREAAAVDGTMYNTTSMLRTMELILGMRPMTHFDAGARPMNTAFSSGSESGSVLGGEAAHPARRPQSGALGHLGSFGKDGFQ